MIVTVINLILLAILLLVYYRPTIDVVTSNGKYKVLLWYNRRIWNSQINRLEIKRDYIHVITL